MLLVELSSVELLVVEPRSGVLALGSVNDMFGSLGLLSVGELVRLLLERMMRKGG